MYNTKFPKRRWVLEKVNIVCIGVILYIIATDICLKKQVSFFMPKSLWQNYVKKKLLFRYKWEAVFFRHLIFSPFPTAVGWEKYIFLFCRYDRIMSFGRSIGWKSERTFFLPLLTRYDRAMSVRSWSPMESERYSSDLCRCVRTMTKTSELRNTGVEG